MPSNRFLKTMNTVHRAALKLTGGKLGNRVAGMPALQLTTIGRRSGKSHTVMLTSPVAESGTIVIVASRGGDDTHPAWFLNLRDNPAVRVSFQQGPEREMTAHIADTEERAELWPRVTAAYQGYAAYQRKTTREIPLVILTPNE